MQLKENEETRGLNDKKDYEDQFTCFFGLVFCQFSLELCFIHPISRTLAHLDKYRSVFGACLEHSSFQWIWRNKAKKSGKAQGNRWINNYNRIILKVIGYMYDFLDAW